MTGNPLTKTQALELVSQQLKTRSPDVSCVIVDSHTIEKPYGWVFFYNSSKFVETGLDQHRLAGNGPVVVNKHDGTVHFFGTSPLKNWIAEYERQESLGKTHR